MPNQPPLNRAAAYICTRITGHAASVLRNASGADVALHLHGEEVAPLTAGGYGVVPVPLGTVVLAPDQARAVAQSLLAAADSAGDASVASPLMPSGPPKQVSARRTSVRGRR